MTETKSTFRPLSPRKEPTQTRSKLKVELILKTTEELLIKDGLDKLTTNHIAQTAGMSVGSLYQYFPNKQSILHEMVCRWLDGVYERMHALMQIDFSNFTIEQLLDMAFEGIYSEGGEVFDRFEIELGNAIQLYPELQAIDQEHGERVAELLANLLKKLGLKASHEELVQLGHYFYMQNELLEDLVAADKCSLDRLLAWHKQATLSVIRSYL